MEDNLLMEREGCGLLRGFFTILAYNDHPLEECIYSSTTADIWSWRRADLWHIGMLLLAKEVYNY